MDEEMSTRQNAGGKGKQPVPGTNNHRLKGVGAGKEPAIPVTGRSW